MNVELGTEEIEIILSSLNSIIENHINEKDDSSINDTIKIIVKLKQSLWEIKS